MQLIDAVTVKALAGRKLELTFEDGVIAVIEMDKIVKNYTGIFEPLLKDYFFNLVKVDPELGTIVWPNGADICPATLYAHATGKPL
ncbi:MAG TPA: DUF2442 domain-containing protein [Bacteroidota bacterium]|nr:DUF2442 domain-containing protein [Bacteroidota bacterium]